IRFLLDSMRDVPSHVVIQGCAADFFRVAIDDVEGFSAYGQKAWLKDRFFELSPHRVYDFVDWLIQTSRGFHPRQVIDGMNTVLEQEIAPVRFVGGILTPITADTEIAALEAALAAFKLHGILGAHDHLRTALSLLGA